MCRVWTKVELGFGAAEKELVYGNLPSLVSGAVSKLGHNNNKKIGTRGFCRA